VTAVSFSTTAQPNPGGVLLIEIPETVVKKLGAGKRVPVRVTLNGAKYRSTTAKARPAFDGFSFSHRREFADAVTSAKRPETRAARIEKIVAQVRAKAKAVSLRGRGP
jgi:hypothetical protein